MRRAPIADSQTHDPRALSEQVYQQLVEIARRRLRHERPGHTLQATALVNEAWIRLGGGQGLHFQDRAHFMAIAAEAMRRVLIDHARKRGASKRGGGGRLVQIESAIDLANEENLADALALDELISRMEQVDAQAARIVRLRLYAGLSIDETAEALRVGRRSVDRDWAFARAWLQREWARGDAG